MGCYHFHLNQLSRGKGQSAIASAAYRAGAKLECTYYGEVSYYTRKGGVVLAAVSYTHLMSIVPEILYLENISRVFFKETSREIYRRVSGSMLRIPTKE